jgi:hypothetical protein
MSSNQMSKNPSFSRQPPINNMILQKLFNFSQKLNDKRLLSEEKDKNII